MFQYRVIPLISAWSSPVLAGHPSNNASHTQYRQLTQVQPVYEGVGINAPAEQYWVGNHPHHSSSSIPVLAPPLAAYSATSLAITNAISASSP
ncbi:MAG: 3-dehydroquinate dehydratase [Zhongshania sp.]|jgi:3-dehydroquinate dehydratase